MKEYKGGTIPKNLDPQLRQLLEDHDRTLVRGIPRSNISPQVLQGPGSGGSKPRGSTSQLSYQVSGVEGNVGTIPPQPFGSIVAWRFTGTPTLLTDSGNLHLNADFTPNGVNSTLTLVCDGAGWFELSRTLDGGYNFDCPVVINDGTPVWEVACDGRVFQRLDLIPDYDFLNQLALYRCGTTSNPWKSINAWHFGGRSILLEGANVSLNVAQKDNWDISNLGVNQYVVYRASTNVDCLVTGVLSWGTSGPTPLFDLINVSAQVITLGNQHGSSTSTNRIITGTGAPLPLSPNDTARLWYDPVTDRWRVLK